MTPKGVTKQMKTEDDCSREEMEYLPHGLSLGLLYNLLGKTTDMAAHDVLGHAEIVLRLFGSNIA